MTETSGRKKVLEEALEPFATFGTNPDGEDLTAGLMRDRICDWFGPSDFRRARAALASPSTQEPGGKVEFGLQEFTERDKELKLQIAEGLRLPPLDGEKIAKALWESQRKRIKNQDGINARLCWRDTSVPGAFWQHYKLDADAVIAALRTSAGESAAQSEPAPDASMTNADWLRAISAWVPQYVDHLNEAADELDDLRAAQSERAGLERAAAWHEEQAKRSWQGSAKLPDYECHVKSAKAIRALSAARKAGGE